MGFREVEADAVGHQNVKNAPQKMGAAPTGDRVEDDYHPRTGIIGESGPAMKLKKPACHYIVSFP
jgi:hypothetical protein